MKIMKTLAFTRRLLFLMLEELERATDESIFNPRITLNDVFYGKGYRYETEKEIKAARIKRAIYQLKHDRFIRVRKLGNRVYYSLTKKGYSAGLKEKIRLADPLPVGEFCLVSFDVPNRSDDQEGIYARFCAILVLKWNMNRSGRPSSIFAIR